MPLMGKTLCYDEDVVYRVQAPGDSEGNALCYVWMSRYKDHPQALKLLIN